MRVFACGDGVCIERRLALRRRAAASAPSGAGRVEVAPGVTVRVPNAPPVAPEVPATRFVATDGSDSGSCQAQSPCQTFNRAYEVASPGEVVDVRGGTYPTQRIENDSGKTSTDDVSSGPPQASSSASPATSSPTAHT